MKQRILTAILAAAVFLPFVIYGNLPFTIFVYLLASIGLYELLRMKKISLVSFPGLISLLILWVLLIPNSYITILNDINFSKAELALLALLFLLTYTVITKNKFTFDDVGFVVISVFYLGIGFYFFIETRHSGLAEVFYALFLIWVTDSGAYFVGRAMGKNKLWPEISPNKTVEGAVGGVLFAVIFAWVYHMFTGVLDSFLIITVMTICLSVFGQIGDLVESAFKRHYQVKDSGSILPGHGGILDRFDSLLFVLPLLHFLNILF
ncbi:MULTISPECIES: phosphatidate cytidylyltransferase [Bacillaceae]|uniref:phosphatidate cytidylyltransferase n=1 Tax=Bacillaceae TaxID=186817 RepID=UPI000BFC7C10|nr:MULTISPECIES: phosphatidate cytidylyltransferase [Bacillaceae]PGT86699.1 phosphatidate cytidylyltransferase [Bacillus sp. AFS040349]UGB32705.1 phosphatidate cytidylyltransferase [Metabacillus sp. B2-18]